MAERQSTLRHFRDLEVYHLAFQQAMRIFRLSGRFPPEERYSLTDQIRRSSRAVCSNLAEAWRKRKYEAVFRNKITDAMSEASETQTWLDFGLACDYLEPSTFSELDAAYEKIIAMLSTMEKKAGSFCY